jgi:hypothetical protein
MKKRAIAQFKENQFKAILSEMESKIDYIQEFVNKYNNLGLKPLENNQFLELFTNPKELFVKKLSDGEKLTIKGMELNNDKLFDLLDKPKQMTSLLEELNEFNNDKIKVNYYQVKNYSINENQVIVSEVTLNRLKEANTIYIETDNQQSAFDEATQLVDALNSLKKAYKFNLNSLENFVKENNGTFTLDASFLKSIN